MINFFKKLFDKGLLGGVQRSSKWNWWKKQYEKTHPKICPICSNKKCSLHHKESFATKPEKELDENNVVWLCDGWGTLQHHRGIGHLGSFVSLNENLDEDIKIWRKKFLTRPKWNGMIHQWEYIGISIEKQRKDTKILGNQEDF